MKAAIFIFAVAAVGGLTLAFLRLSGTENPPTWMAIAHGVIAATALVSLIVAAAQYGLPSLAKAALGVFVVAALAGGFLFLSYGRTAVADTADRPSRRPSGDRLRAVARGSVWPPEATLHVMSGEPTQDY